MPDNCLPKGTSIRVTDTPFGAGPVHEAAQSQIHLLDEAQDAFLQADIDAARKNQQIDAIAALADGNEYVGERANKTQEKQARSIIRPVLREIQRIARGAEEARVRSAQELIRHVSGSSTGQANWFTNLKNSTYTAFVNAKGEFNKWLAVTAASPHMEQYRNPLIMAFEGIDAQSYNIAYRFREMMDRVMDKHAPLANRSGMTLNDFMYVMGDYHAARHVPERNDFLIERWNNEAAKERDAAAATTNRREQAEHMRRAGLFEHRANLLRTHIDDINPVLEPGDARHFYSAGMTNAQARQQINDILHRTGLTAAEADGVARDIMGIYDAVALERARAGTMSSFQAEAMNNNFQWYGALLSKNSEWLNNQIGAPNDASPYNPGSYHAIMGLQSRPDSTWQTLGYYVNRAAAEIASADFGMALNAIYMKGRQEGWGEGTHLRAIDYDNLVAQRYGSDSERALHAAAYNAMYNRGGFVANVKERDPRTGRINTTKKFFFFSGSDFEFNGAKFSVGDLNKALSSSFKSAEVFAPVRTMAAVTSGMGQAMTRFTGLFSPVSGLRDFGERASLIPSRTYTDATGKEFSGASIVPAFLGNATRAGGIMYKGLLGKLDPNTPAGLYWREFTEQGLTQKFVQRARTRDRSLEETLNAPNDNTLAARLGLNTPILNRMLNSLGVNKRRFMRIVDGWNDYFQNISAFTHYLTLRERNVTANDAARYVREMMNMSIKGSAAPYLQALAPFVVPTVQSGTALARALGLGATNPKDILKSGYKGYLTLAAAFLGYTMLAPLVREALGQNERGEYYYDSMSVGELSRMIPIPLNDNGEFFRMHFGFGMPQVAATMAISLERVNQGRMTPSDMLFETLFTILKNSAPGAWPEYEFSKNPTAYITSMVTPQPLRPFAEVAMNTNRWGNPIWYAPKDELTSKADSGSTATPRRFHYAAQFWRDTVGLDQSPEAYQYLESQFFLGPLRAVTSMGNQIDDIYKGSSRPSALNSVHPALAALGITSWYGKAPNPSQSLYYEAKRHYESLIRMSGVDLAAPQGSSSAEAEAYKRQQLATIPGFTPQMIQDYVDIWRAETASQQLGRRFNRQYKDAWHQYDTSAELRQAFDTLYDETTALYADTVSKLAYYGNR